MPRRAVKSVQPIPITTPLNISALARDAGVSRKTIQRRLAKGWRPEAHSARTPAQARPANVPLNVHRAAPVSIQLPTGAQLRPPLGVLRTVLLLLGVGFYVLIACAAVGR